MLKFAYQLGVKLALAEEGLPEEETPADQLTNVLQRISGTGQETRPPKMKGIGDPTNDDPTYDTRSINYAFEDLSRLGLDVQGPESTAI